MSKLCIAIVVCLALVTIGGTEEASALTKNGAELKASQLAVKKWSATVIGEEPCVGEFENVKGKTQWACYGILYNGPYAYKYWQINLDPYGTDVFDRLCTNKCPGSPWVDT
jgi:hypothetical protein